MIPVSKQLKEVTVTAVEATGMTSSSTITREAIEHIQPTSFTDVLELLPADYPKTLKWGLQILLHFVKTAPRMRLMTFHLWELPCDRWCTAATDANLQYLPKAGATDPDYQRQVVNKGVDMRTISTDDIEK